MRSVVAASRAAAREAEREQKRQLKLELAADAEEAVFEWEERLEELVSLHKKPSQPIDWKTIAEALPPQLPIRLSSNQKKAQSAVDSFKPKLFDKFRGGAQKRLSKLEAAVSDAIKTDEHVYGIVKDKFQIKLEEHEVDTSIAKRLVEGEVDAIREVISEMQTLSTESELGTFIGFTIKKHFLHVTADLFDDSVVPNFRRKQLASGKLSETKMPVGEFNELYQDYVSSAAFRVARNMFDILPLEEIYVTCRIEMLDSTTGHLKQSPILSVQFVRATFDRLNLNSIDPSDALRNFNHSESFKRTKGYQIIEALKD